MFSLWLWPIIVLCYFRDQNTKSKSSDLANARFARLKLNKYTYLLQVFANHALFIVFVCICVCLPRAAARERNQQQRKRERERERETKTVRTICMRMCDKIITLASQGQLSCNGCFQQQPDSTCRFNVHTVSAQITDSRLFIVALICTNN